ncbi:MAG: ATP-binding cassette domain-containing protein [Clostridia bacterium]|nr:ATP-binding cassette domain-containing protein [Clostridia bacterium]
MLKIKNAVKIFAKDTPNEHIALNNLNLSLNTGDFVTIVGSNGAGKSTLFNSVCGNFWLDKGHIILDNEDITYLPEHKRALKIGRVFQDPMKGTAPNLTIEENIALAYSKNKKGMFSFAVNRKEREMFRQSLSEFNMGLEDRMKTKVGLLSGGQRQVVTLLMCTLVMPKLLLLDEHTAALDPATAEKVMDITNTIVKKNKLTTLMITHNLSSALVTGNRTIMMDEGTIILDLSNDERKNMSIDDLLNMYSGKKNKKFDNDRMLLN